MMTREQQALAASELTLASALAQYVKCCIACRDAELIERLGRKFKEPATIARMRELLRDE